MKIQIRCALFITVMGVSLSLVSTGSNAENRWELTINPGYSIAVGDFGDTYGNSAALQATALYQATSWLATGLEVAW
jgi:hypothetical protein